MLLLDGANRRSHLDWAMEFLVKVLAEIFDEVARPRTAVAPGFGEILSNTQIIAFAKRNQFFGLLEQQELIVIFDSWQLQHVELHILAKKGFVGAAKYGI